jgi:hypothetical protein
VAEADRLTRQQVGRVRADLQYRLQKSGRALNTAIRERYAASTATIEKAVDDAARMQGRTETETAEIYADLQRREAAIQGVLQYLTKPRRPPTAEAGHRSDFATQGQRASPVIRPTAAAPVPVINSPNALRAAAAYRRSSSSPRVSKLAVLNVV